MLRRCEFALGKAIRAGQEAGEIAEKSDNRFSNPPSLESTSYKVAPTDFATAAELSGNASGIYAMSDGVTPEDFEDALTCTHPARGLAPLRLRAGPLVRVPRNQVVAARLHG